jgi:hypothetical protein
MSTNTKIPVGLDNLLQTILENKDRSCRRLSRTFWQEVGIKRRTPEGAKQVWSEMQKRGVSVNLNEKDFGKERPGTWLTFTFSEVATVWAAGLKNIYAPPKEWFEEMARKEYESEKEVEFTFLLPLIKMLGYEEEDIAMDFPVHKFEGSRKLSGRADVALFEGESRNLETVLLIAEAKQSEKLAKGISEARSYADWVKAPAYLITNAVDIQVFLRHPIHYDTPAFLGNIFGLQNSWKEFWNIASKEAVKKYKWELNRKLQGL